MSASPTDQKQGRRIAASVLRHRRAMTCLGRSGADSPDAAATGRAAAHGAIRGSLPTRDGGRVRIRRGFSWIGGGRAGRLIAVPTARRTMRVGAGGMRGTRLLPHHPAGGSTGRTANGRPYDGGGSGTRARRRLARTAMPSLNMGGRCAGGGALHGADGETERGRWRENPVDLAAEAW